MMMMMMMLMMMMMMKMNMDVEVGGDHDKNHVIRLELPGNINLSDQGISRPD